MMAEDIAPLLPVGLAEAKAFLRIEHDLDDALIAAMLRASAQLCERFTGELMIARRATETVPADGNWHRLKARPVRSIDDLAGLDAHGVRTVLPPEAYGIDIDADGDGWVRVTGGTGARAEVGYAAGRAADWNGLPEPLRAGVVRMAAHLYTHRDGPDDAPPAAVAALWRPWRRMRLG